MSFPFNKLMWFAAATSLAVALSGCGGGGGGISPMAPITGGEEMTGGGTPAARDTQELPGGHGLAAGEITVAPGASQEHGNVVVSCPPGGTACALTVALDGTASYDRTGGMPSVTAARDTQELPGGHGLAAGEITVAPGASQEHGNVVARVRLAARPAPSRWRSTARPPMTGPGECPPSRPLAIPRSCPGAMAWQWVRSPSRRGRHRSTAMS